MRGSIGVLPGLLLAAIAALVMAGCDTLKEQAGLTKRPPDEFTVVTKAPLVMPPDFSLRPPRPGAKRPQEKQPRDTARSAVAAAGGDGRGGARGASRIGQAAVAAAGGRSGGAPATAGPAPDATEAALLSKAGALGSDPSIRETINRESTVLAEKDKSFTDRLIFWQKTEAYGSTVDATKEAQRLREAAAAGKPITGGQTPVIKRRKRGILEGIF
ncbi:MAG: DUF3035 domain-containing protein [Alphaproteobacteria bacterium]|nr:DUF3035 domain-containing protein [Alphaproteobacteria bacterium]MDP6812922.1 DUF3035 domain-containing protein [Alphaproteobacteria bacterium]